LHRRSPVAEPNGVGAAFTDWIVLLIPIAILDIALKGIGEALWLVVVFAYFTYFEGGPRGQTPLK
jgi:hypothetical protein